MLKGVSNHSTIGNGWMFSRFAIVVLSLMLSVNAVAQRTALAQRVDSQRPLFERLLSIEVGAPQAGSSNQVVPLWASSDGRLLAIVALSSNAGAPALPPSPAFGGVSDFRIVDATDLFSAGLRLRVAQRLRADVTLGQISLSPRSYEIVGQADCLQGSCLADRSQFANATALSANIGLGWSPEFSDGLDFSFGLSWLDGRNSQMPVLAQTSMRSLPIDLAVLEVPGIASYKLSAARRLSARGAWQIGQGSVIDLTASMGRVELSPIWSGLSGSGLDLNQTALGLGVTRGSLRGSIVGRITSLDEPGIVGNRRWSGLDLGVSWRTPWRGEVTVGAQNLWSAPLDSAAPRELDASQARMPYVQYRQDL